MNERNDRRSETDVGELAESCKATRHSSLLSNQATSIDRQWTAAAYEYSTSPPCCRHWVEADLMTHSVMWCQTDDRVAVAVDRQSRRYRQQ